VLDGPFGGFAGIAEDFLANDPLSGFAEVPIHGVLYKIGA
jgi:hypothetical protein